MDMRLLLYVRVMLFCWLVNSFDAAGGPQTSGPVPKKQKIYIQHTHHQGEQQQQQEKKRKREKGMDVEAGGNERLSDF